jgi:hypothetical protein
MPEKNHALLRFMNRRFTPVVSSCPRKIDAQVSAGVQITLAREKFSFLKINNDENKRRSFFLHIKQQQKKLYYTKNDRNNYNKNKTEI